MEITLTKTNFETEVLKSDKPVLVDFWAPWCGGCCRELPDFQRLQEDYGERVTVLAVHSSMLTDAPEDFIAESGYTFRFALDADDTMIPSLGGSTMLPQTVILAPDGTVVFNETRSMSYEKLVSVILPLLGEGTELPTAAAPADAEADAAAETAAGTADYIVHVTDAAGAGIAGAKVQFCTAMQCLLEETDVTGTAVYTGMRYPYEVHLLKVPAPFSGTAEVFTMPEEGGEMTITVSAP